MNIAYLHSCKWPSNSPGVTFSTDNAVGLARAGLRCHLFVKKNSPMRAEEVFKKYFNFKKPPALTIHQIKKPLINSNYFFYKKAYKIMQTLIKEKELDAVITRRTTFLPHLIKLKNKYDVKVYFESHDFYSDLSLRDDIKITDKKKHARLERKYIPRLDGLICLQNSQKKLYQKIYSRTPIKVFRTGFLKHIKSGEKKEYLTYIGSLDRLKGVETLIKAASLCRSRPKLLIIGGKSGRHINELNSFIKDNYPSADIEITGWVNKKILRRLLKKTKIGIVPLTNTFFNRHITSPLKIFDYFSCGIPVIASELPTTKELIDENKSGVFFKPEDSPEMAEKIDTLINDKAKLRQMRSYIFNNTSELLWETRGKKIADWIKSC